MARIRHAFVAPPGRALLSVDFDQLGLYVLAHLSGDPALVEPLSERRDLHRLTAAAVLDRRPEEITAEERQLGKEEPRPVDDSRRRRSASGGLRPRGREWYRGAMHLRRRGRARTGDRPGRGARMYS